MNTIMQTEATFRADFVKGLVLTLPGGTVRIKPKKAKPFRTIKARVPAIANQAARSKAEFSAEIARKAANLMAGKDCDGNTLPPEAVAECQINKLAATYKEPVVRALRRGTKMNGSQLKMAAALTQAFLSMSESVNDDEE